MLGFSFSFKRLIGVTALKQKIAKTTGIPTTKNGVARKLGQTIINAIAGKK